MSKVINARIGLQNLDSASLFKGNSSPASNDGNSSTGEKAYETNGRADGRNGNCPMQVAFGCTQIQSPFSPLWTLDLENDDDNLNPHKRGYRQTGFPGIDKEVDGLNDLGAAAFEGIDDLATDPGATKRPRSSHQAQNRAIDLNDEVDLSDEMWYQFGDDPEDTTNVMYADDGVRGEFDDPNLDMSLIQSLGVSFNGAGKKVDPLRSEDHGGNSEHHGSSQQQTQPQQERMPHQTFENDADHTTRSSNETGTNAKVAGAGQANQQTGSPAEDGHRSGNAQREQEDGSMEPMVNMPLGEAIAKMEELKERFAKKLGDIQAVLQRKDAFRATTLAQINGHRDEIKKYAQQLEEYRGRVQ
ncbi:hypothetical protein HK102_007742, partial [Quaeritorhiza haematococci]